MSDIDRTIELENIDNRNQDRSHTSISLGWELVLGERIGSGANGDVYIGKIIGDNTSEEVAVKYPNRDPNSIKSLREEVQISSQLVHSYIAKTRLLDESDGNPKIIMDYIDGHNLSTIGKKHNDLALRFPQKLTALIGWLCSQGLDYAHNNTFKDLEDNSVKGAIHRDLSPNNLIIDNNEGTPFIIDFGTAVLSTDTPKIIGKRSGTLGYAAYETLRGDQIDH
ncbi:hypothetical protein CMI42_04070, partial [Candidatus Pacearchaeota archaeon]|nr:hypothetical protein [Candidatus Pacearchaeota archaeon]